MGGFFNYQNEQKRRLIPLFFPLFKFLMNFTPFHSLLVRGKACCKDVSCWDFVQCVMMGAWFAHLHHYFYVFLNFNYFFSHLRFLIRHCYALSGF